MYAKKSLGQHFLRSTRALDKIIEAGNISPNNTILEIGPGTGALTERLLATGARVIAVEKDDHLFLMLQKKFPTLELVHADILDLEIENLKIAVRGSEEPSGSRRENYKLIANIPYNITGAILEKFLSAEHQPEKLVLLVQKEVAQRIVTRDSKPLDSARGKESILSISVKAYGTPRYVDTVKAGSFVPAPTVDSAIIAIENVSKAFFTTFSEPDFFKILKAGFKSKRKKLSSNLSPLFPKEKVAETFRKLGLDENVRAEDVGIETWQHIAHLLLS